MSSAPALVELRRYALRGGQRETLVRLFESELVTPQHEAGMSVLGPFRDLDDPDQFVWMRGFDDAASRGPALRAFYEGPVWARHRDAANATMISSDDVLLLRPLSGRALPRTADLAAGIVVVTLYEPDDLDAFTVLMAEQGDAVLAELGSVAVAAYATADVVNTFPALPVREDVDAYVRVARFASASDHAAHRRRLESASTSRGVLSALRSSLTRELRLARTGRSASR